MTTGQNESPLRLYVPAALVMPAVWPFWGDAAKSASANNAPTSALLPQPNKPEPPPRCSPPPELPNIRIQAYELDDALRQNAAYWGKVATTTDTAQTATTGGVG